MAALRWILQATLVIDDRLDCSSLMDTSVVSSVLGAAGANPSGSRDEVILEWARLR